MSLLSFLRGEVRPREQVAQEVADLAERRQLVGAEPPDRKLDVRVDRDAVPGLRPRPPRGWRVPRQVPQHHREPLGCGQLLRGSWRGYGRGGLALLWLGIVRTR